eukprot:CAMPEP_0184714488 /NCGR_PEP_ID=MMETSP0314-20130426/4612_1 /TAXON_ID=38298 /ORGANISM="Rhodella maculata, Strain CCMP 736" /LENGTH=44 /DNA_ID= /DNA_START= /DNA_END= /DNA_ORIENTATION=
MEEWGRGAARGQVNGREVQASGRGGVGGGGRRRSNNETPGIVQF